MFFDSHAHFESLDGNMGLAALVKRAKEAGVDRIVAIGGSPEMNISAVEAAERYPGNIFAAIGCDREHANLTCDPLKFDAMLSSSSGIVAVGEIGLDFHYHPEKPPAQLEFFEHMLGMAAGHNLPVVVHSRNAEEETLALLEKHAGQWRGESDRLGVLHCFTASREFAFKVLDLGFYIGFSGIITFKNAGDLRQLASEVPADRILIETDTPYLAPEPYRGKTNEPAYLPRIAETVAEVRGVSLEEAARLTAANTERLFGV